MLTEKQQIAAAASFVERWSGRGYEKGDSQSFWLDLLTSVFGIDNAVTFIRFEEQVKVDATNFIDGHIPSTRVLIEQKSLGKDLRKGIVQSNGSVLNPFQQAKRYVAGMPLSRHPRWIVTCNFAEFLVYDMEQPNGEPASILLKDLEKEYYRLQFLVDAKSEHLSKEVKVSKEAGDIVGKIYEALLAQYLSPFQTSSSPKLGEVPRRGGGVCSDIALDDLTLRWLNILCVRIVFCLYAEDAGVFRHDQFHDYLTRYDAEDLRRALRDLFDVLNTPPEKRSKYLKDDLKAFPYTNGGLFEEEIEIPQFTESLKQTLLQNASLDFDWSEISPTIFGAVFESTLNPETRRSGGMHYTSIENIHKVIDPLFLNDLRRELDEILEEKVERVRQRRLDAYQDRLASLTFLDPACGSGNFLTETYLSLRRLENEVIRERHHGQTFMGFRAEDIIKVSIQQFYGIEINDFAVTVATTALWISEAQMLAETERIVKHDFDFLPLKSYTNIREGNALRMDWDEYGARTSPSAAGGTPALLSTVLPKDFHSRGYLPHVENKSIQAITFRLADSVPNDTIEQWKTACQLFESKEPDEEQYDNEATKLHKLIEQYEDQGYGECLLRNDSVAQIVADTLKYYDGQRYRLLKWCIMPNHVHVVVHVYEGYSLSTIVQGWRSYSSHQICKLLGREGTIWMAEYFDRFIRSDKHLEFALNYVAQNPVKAGLCASPDEWKWSSSWSADVPVRSGRDARAPYASPFDYIIGNPPFVGARQMSSEQKQDVLSVFGEKWRNVGNLDYVCCWYKRAWQQAKQGRTKVAFVSTNSICQGEQVANLWEPLFEEGLHIDFAHRTFRWDSESSTKAQVHCIIVGFSKQDDNKDECLLFDNDKVSKVKHINAYLTAAPDIFLWSRPKPICEVPEIGMGNQPIDGGNYLFTKEEMEAFINLEPASAKYFHPFYGAYEFINQKPRYCLWLGDCTPAELRSMPHCMRRVEAVREVRLASKRASTLRLADRPTRFQTENFPSDNYIVIPEVSSEKRRYIPMGMMTPNEICSNKLRILPHVSLYHFGVLQSNVHMAWMRAVAGRLEMRYDYSINIVYNNFPWPAYGARTSPSAAGETPAFHSTHNFPWPAYGARTSPSAAGETPAFHSTHHIRIEQTAQAILDARAKYPDSSLADLYDDLTMPADLRKAHQDNDRAVMAAYGWKASSQFTESQCVAELFKMYKELTEERR